jgi:hypothetical protein
MRLWEKRRRAAALQDAMRNTLIPEIREAFWSAPALWRFTVGECTARFFVCQCQERENHSRSFENLYDWIGRTLIRKTRDKRKLFPLLGERIKGEGGRNTHSTENVEEAIFFKIRL